MALDDPKLSLIYRDLLYIFTITTPVTPVLHTHITTGLTVMSDSGRGPQTDIWSVVNKNTRQAIYGSPHRILKYSLHTCTGHTDT